MTTQLTPPIVMPTEGGPGAPSEEIRRSGLVAGIGILALAVLAGVANFGVVEGLVTENDPGTTAKDILASQGVFRFGIISLLVVAVLDVVVAWALLTFFAPVISGTAVLFGMIEPGSGPQVIATIPEFFWELSLGIYLLVKGFRPALVASGSRTPAAEAALL